MRKRIIAFISFVLLICLLVSCGKGNELDTNETQPNIPMDTQPALNEKLTSLKINGTDISEYRIVYPVSFTREQCFEDMLQAADRLSSAIEEIVGIRLTVIADTDAATKHEIILGAATRSECIRYYNEATKLKTDEYCVVYSNGKILLGADCLAGVMDACDVFSNYLKEEAVKGNTAVDIKEDFDLSGKKHVTRIVCVGDSITQGVGATDEIKESYPAQLQKNLGCEYDVVNYGKGGATMCSYSEASYTTRSYIDKSGYYDDLIAIAPYTDAVVIMLGSNDGSGSAEVTSLLQNNFDTFKMDYTLNLTKMVKELREANKDIKIMVFSTTKAYSGVREININTYIRPLQKQLCESLKLDHYDMFKFSYTTMSSADFGDGLHPTAAGYVKMGAEAAKVLKAQYNFK